MVKFAVEFWWKMLLMISPAKKSSKISCQTSPEVRHQFRRKLRQLHSGNRWCLHFRNKQGTKIQPRVGLTGSWTSAPSGYGCPRPNPCFPTILSALTEVLGQKLPLWADFSFLKESGATKIAPCLDNRICTFKILLS